jgi:hypothetical protein
MKKNFKKKLGLNKKTIANLEKNSMGNIQGGGITDTCTCPQTCIDPCLPNTTPIQCPPTAWRCTYEERECKPQH